MTMKMLIIIPALNEERVIGDVIADIRHNAPGMDIVVINDGSADATGAVAAAAGVTVVNLPYNLGIGAAVQTGYKYAKRNGYDIAVQFDGDGQHRADQLEALLAPLIKGEADAVIGSRFLIKSAYDTEIYRYVAIRILARIISFFVRRRITDPTSGFRAVNMDVIRYFSYYYPDDYPEPEAIVLLDRAGFRVAEIPVLMQQRMMGSSSITFLRGIYYMGKVLLAIAVDMLKKATRS
jgi:glycosyltransferase involved in cell wall biosynthesis